MATSACSKLINQTTQEIWRRGEEYVGDGLVSMVEFNDKRAVGIVTGTKTYGVDLAFSGGGLSKMCDCPYFTKYGAVCKHLVALALAWDGVRGISPPPVHVVDVMPTQPRRRSQTAIDRMYGSPLEASLDDLRALAEETALGGRGRPHSKLPEVPKHLPPSPTPPTVKEIGKSFSEIKSWSRRKTYDPYFCSGEMVAAYCETIRRIDPMLDSMDLEEAVEFLYEVEAFNRTLITELIDDSLGLHVFSIAYVDALYERLCERMNREGASPGLKRQLDDYRETRDDW